MNKNGNREIERLKSENYVAKNKITLIERKNSILEEENLIQKREIKQKNAEYDTLLAEKKAVLEKYYNELSLLTDQYDNLEAKNKILEKESSEKIQELTRLNKTLEQTMGNKIKAMNEQIKNREIESAAVMEKVKKDHAMREFALSLAIEESKKAITKNEEKILSLGRDLKSLKADHEKSLAIIAGKDAMIKGLLETLEGLRTRNDELGKALKEKEDLLKEKAKEKGQEKSRAGGSVNTPADRK